MAATSSPLRIWPVPLMPRLAGEPCSSGRPHAARPAARRSAAGWSPAMSPATGWWCRSRMDPSPRAGSACDDGRLVGEPDGRARGSAIGGDGVAGSWRATRGRPDGHGTRRRPAVGKRARVSTEHAALRCTHPSTQRRAVFGNDPVSRVERRTATTAHRRACGRRRQRPPSSRGAGASRDLADRRSRRASTSTGRPGAGDRPRRCPRRAARRPGAAIAACAGAAVLLVQPVLGGGEQQLGAPVEGVRRAARRGRVERGVGVRHLARQQPRGPWRSTAARRHEHAPARRRGRTAQAHRPWAARRRSVHADREPAEHAAARCPGAPRSRRRG